MYPRGHAGISLIISSPIVLFLGVSNLITSVSITIIIMWVSIIPDIDISNKSILDKTDHRGVTHTIWFGIILSIFSFAFFEILNYYVRIDINSLLKSIAVLVGIISHQIGDIINNSGIKPFKIGSFGDFEICYTMLESDNSCYNNIIFVVGTVCIITSILFVGVF